jgi:hypothetical protein
MVKTLTKFSKDNKGKEVEEAWFEENTYVHKPLGGTNGNAGCVQFQIKGGRREIG